MSRFDVRGIYRVTVLILDILSADQHGSIGFEEAGIQLLGSSEFYHESVGIEYSAKGKLGKVARLSRLLKYIQSDEATKHNTLF
jgi:hypothetical protein